MLFFLYHGFIWLFCSLFNTFFRNMYCIRAEKLLILRQNKQKNKYNQKLFVIKSMKKTLLMGAAICAVFAMTSCKSKESAYKKAYEKAKAQQETVVTTPVTTQTPTQVAVTPTAPVTSTPAADYSNVQVRTENVSLVNGAPLKAYSVVIGSFSVQSNATALSAALTGKGYTPRVVKAVVNGADWYRVVATSYDTKAEAAQSRAALEGQYPGAWLLYQK